MTVLSFGTYPNISLAEAKAMRRETRSLIAKDINPKSHKEDLAKKECEQKENTFKKVATKWFEVKSTELKPSTAAKAWPYLELHLFPYIENTPLSEINAKDIIRILQPIKEQGHLTVIQRLCQRLNEIMNFGINTGIILNNPSIGIKSAFSNPISTNHKSISTDRIPELMSFLQGSNMQIKTRSLVEWQFHTMTRPSESAKAKWLDIDLENKIWTIPAEDMKGKNAPEHIVPLTKQTMALLTLMHPISGRGEFIFPSHKNPKQHANTEASNNALKRTPIGSEQSGHGLRTIARTAIGEQGFDYSACEACLAHKIGSQVSQVYNKATYLNQRIKIMEWWSNHIEQASIGNMSVTGRMGLKVVNGQ